MTGRLARCRGRRAAAHLRRRLQMFSLLAGARSSRRRRDACRRSCCSICCSRRAPTWRGYDAARARELLERLATLSGRRPREATSRATTPCQSRARGGAARSMRCAGRRRVSRASRPCGCSALSGSSIPSATSRSPQRAVAAIADTITAQRAAGPARGRPVDSTALHAAIEAQGAVVVARSARWAAGPPGPMSTSRLNLYVALVEHYRRESIDARMPVAVLMRRMEKSLAGIDAVVVSLPPDDASFGWDYPRLRELFARRSVPHAVLHSDPASAHGCVRSRTPRDAAHGPFRDGGDGMAEKQLESTAAAAAFQKQWFAELRRRVFDERQPYALVQADVPFELFDLLEIPAVSNQWWSSLVAAKRQAPAFLDAMAADGLPNQLCRYCSLGFATTRYRQAGEAPWGGLPTPRLLCARLTCDCIHRVFSLWAEAFDAELFEIDHPGASELPPRWWELSRHRWRELVEPHRLDFVATTLERLVERLEAIGDRRLDRTALRERLERVNRQEEIFDAARKLIACRSDDARAHDRADRQCDGHAMGARHRLGTRACGAVLRRAQAPRRRRALRPARARSEGSCGSGRVSGTTPISIRPSRHRTAPSSSGRCISPSVPTAISATASTIRFRRSRAAPRASTSTCTTRRGRRNGSSSRRASIASTRRSCCTRGA